MRKSVKLFFYLLLTLSMLMASITNAQLMAQESQLGAVAEGFSWNAQVQGRFITAMADGYDGSIWIGTEGEGVWRYSSGTKRWTHYLTGDGLGDNTVYAIACDHEGHVWVGHQCHGASLFDGTSWRNFSILDGLIGERIFAVEWTRDENHVFFATNAGLTAYDVREQRWRSFTVANGLPANQVQSPAATAAGMIAACQVDAIASASPSDGFKKWSSFQLQPILGVRAQGENPCGLHAFPNQALVAKSGVLYLATSSGLAYRMPGTVAFTFLHGKNWKGKLEGVYIAKDKDKDEKDVGDRYDCRLEDDYISAIAEDSNGLIFVGYREGGYSVINPIDLAIIAQSKDETLPRDSFVKCFLHCGAVCLVGTYGSGVVVVPAAAKPRSVTTGRSRDKVVKLPKPAFTALRPEQSIEDAREWIKLQGQQVDARRGAADIRVLPLDDDWTTKGDWLGRYGRYWACLMAVRSPNNLWWGFAAEPGEGRSERTQVGLRIFGGPARVPDDAPRYYVHWLYTQDERSLELAPQYAASRIQNKLTKDPHPRRQAEVDDHGEAVSMNVEGPDIFLSLTVPKGVYALSLYFFNKDGHGGSNRLRDYIIEIKDVAIEHQKPGFLLSVEGMKELQKHRALATSRVVDFWGGVYKRFAISSGSYVIRVSRNNSFNTILSGVFLDPIGMDSAAEITLAGWNAWSKTSDEEANSKRRRLATDIKEANLAPFGPGNFSTIAKLLTSIESTNPMAWARTQRFACLTLARHVAGAPPLAPDDEVKALHGLQQFSAWENALEAAGVTSPRKVEHLKLERFTHDPHNPFN